jgi:Zn-dependent protease
LGSSIPHFIAFSLTVTMVIHELGHLIAFELNGVPARMIFLVVVGGASPFKDYNRKFNQLPWARQASIVLAGVGGNIILAIAAYFLYLNQGIPYMELMRLLNLTGLLIFWNLLPFWITDGAHFTKLLFNSVSENRDTKFEIGLVLWFSLVLFVLGIICGKISVGNLWFFLWGLHYQANHDDPRGSRSPMAIPEHHQKWWAALYLAIMTIGVVLMMTTPEWFTNPK